MNANRRGFFGALLGLTGGSLVAPARESESAREIREVGEAFARLRADMERPINVTIQIDGRDVAKHAVQAMPEMLKRRGIQ